MSAYIHTMTRDELVAEIRDLMLWGVAAPHEVPDATILPLDKLRPLLTQLRVRALVWGMDRINDTSEDASGTTER